MKWTLFFIALLNASIVRAEGNGMALQTTLGRSTQKFSYSGSQEVENTASHMDLKFTYSWPSGISVGGLYSSLQNISSLGNDSRSGLAVVLGYQYNASYYADVAYFLASQLVRSNGSTYDAGTSFAFDFGYNFKVTSSIFIGLGIVYKSFYWTESLSGSVKSLAVNTMSEFYPAFNLGWAFY